MILYLETVGYPYRVSYLPGLAKHSTCLLCDATQINDIDKASSNHGKQGSSAPRTRQSMKCALPVVAHVYDRLTPTSRP